MCVLKQLEKFVNDKVGKVYNKPVTTIPEVEILGSRDAIDTHRGGGN